MSETALAVQEPSQNRIATFAPQTFHEAIEFADRLAKSSLIPTEFRGKPENVLVAMQHGAELGLPPMQSLNCICVINGKPAIYGPSALAVVKAHRDFEYINESFNEATWTAACEVKRRGEPAVVRTFSKEDAVRAGLWDERKTITRRDGGGTIPNPAPWFCYPKRMLMFRARGFALNDCLPDALRGIITAEEAGDYPGPTIDATPTPQSDPEPPKPTDPPIGKDKAMEWFKAYKASGWTAEDARKWLAETLKVEKSFDIPASKFDEAMQWAKTPNPEKQPDK